MGLIVKTFARVGAVGGLARSLARSFKSYLRSDVETIRMEDILKYAIAVRYGREAQSNPHGNGAILMVSLKTLIDMKQIESLIGLAILILVLEARFFDNDVPVQIELVEVLEEVLLNKRVPLKVALGSTFERGDSARILQSVFPAIKLVLQHTR